MATLCPRWLGADGGGFRPLISIGRRFLSTLCTSGGVFNILVFDLLSRFCVIGIVRAEEMMICRCMSMIMNNIFVFKEVTGGNFLKIDIYI